MPSNQNEFTDSDRKEILGTLEQRCTVTRPEVHGGRIEWHNVQRRLTQDALNRALMMELRGGGPTLHSFGGADLRLVDAARLCPTPPCLLNPEVADRFDLFVPYDPEAENLKWNFVFGSEGLAAKSASEEALDMGCDIMHPRVYEDIQTRFRLDTDRMIVLRTPPELRASGKIILGSCVDGSKWHATLLEVRANAKMHRGTRVRYSWEFPPLKSH